MGARNDAAARGRAAAMWLAQHTTYPEGSAEEAEYLAAVIATGLALAALRPEIQAALDRTLDGLGLGDRIPVLPLAETSTGERPCS
jgi:hypothetical protein